MVVILYYLENNGKKITCLCSVKMQSHFFFSIFDPQLVESMDNEALGSEQRECCICHCVWLVLPSVFSRHIVKSKHKEKILLIVLNFCEAFVFFS